MDNTKISDNGLTKPVLISDGSIPLLSMNL